MTFERQEPSFQPYFIGCQGPSKGRCNSTIAKCKTGECDLNHNWCGVGCGYEICVQPGTLNSTLQAYLAGFGKGMDWIDKHTVNDYSVCPECYRQNASGSPQQLQQARAAKRNGLCRICSKGVCAKCQKCKTSSTAEESLCASCKAGGCLPSCDTCWENPFFVV
mmetsp:Transcript_36969/g.64470  ORF Transcript_36969/g.64470 Transcript_36969/m.64470 type:complete len:164 (+) Transcript_36969:499-990(+)